MKKALCSIIAVLLLFSISLSCAEIHLGEMQDASQEEGSLEQLSGALSGNNLIPDEENLISSDLAASGSTVWQIAGSEIICTNVISQEEIARIALTEMYNGEIGKAALQAAGFPFETEYVPNWFSLISHHEAGVWLCMALKDEMNTLHVFLYDLALSDQSIRITGVMDKTKLLSQFFDEGSNWLEIDMINNGDDAVIIAALDQGFQFNLFCYSPENDQLASLGSRLLLQCTAAVPNGSDLLLVGPSIESTNTLVLTPLQIQSGNFGDPVSIEVDFDPSAAFNFAWNQEEHTLFFTVNNSAYKVNPDSGEKPVPFFVLENEPLPNRLGLIVGNKYILYAQDGSLLHIDTHSELKSTRIQISDASGNASLPEIAPEYNHAQMTYYVTVSVCEDENLFLEYLLNQSTDNDIYVVTLNSDVYHAIKDRGYYIDLSGSEVIRKAVEDMPEVIRNAVSSGETLAALPISVYNECLSLNVKALQKLTGLSRAEIPTDWPSFLRLLNQMAKDGTLLENTQYTVLDSAHTASDLKQQLFTQIMSDCLLWMNRNQADPDAIPSILLPVLQAFNEIDWNGFGLPEEAPEDITWLLSNEQVPLLSIIQPEIAVMALEDGVEYWPLSMNSDSDRLIPQTVFAMVINPWSSHPKGAQAFMEFAWEHLDILPKMSLCLSMNEPVQNTTYSEDSAYLEQLLSFYDETIADATGAEAEAMRRERDELAAFLEEYRLNAQWLTSEKSIRDYRALNNQFELAAPEFWSVDNEDSAVLQFLDGMMPAEQFVVQYVETMKTARLEGY